MKKIIASYLCMLLCLASLNSNAQKCYTKTGKISFFSSTALENIEASNRSVTALLDSKTGELQFTVLVKGFEFKKALMQEHFNENYLETDKFPKASFKGQVLNNSEINYAADGSYPARVKGQLTIHGQTKDIETTGVINIKDGKPVLNSTFSVLIADYKINVQRIHQDNISKSIKITVEAALTPL